MRIVDDCSKVRSWPKADLKFGVFVVDRMTAFGKSGH